jgi:CrcB protein
MTTPWHTFGLTLGGVALAGMLGCTLRFGLITLIQTLTQTTPYLFKGGMGWQASAWGVLWVNLLGCAMAGVLMRWVAIGGVSPELKTVLQVGFLGGLTTFSSLITEYVALAHHYGYWHAMSLLYLLASIALGTGAYLVCLKAG